MSRGQAAFLATILVLSCACGSGGGSQAGPVSIRGAVLDSGGQPQAGAAVVLVSEAELGEAASGSNPGAASAAVSCLASDGCGTQRATTGPDGAFSFTVPRADGDGWYQLATAAGAGGPSVSARFQPAGDMNLPPLRLWAPQVELSVGRTVRASWEPRDPAARERVVFFGAGGRVVWMAEGRGSMANDGRVLEDARGTTVVESIGESEPDDGTVKLTYRSAPVPFAGTTGPPPSRNLPCVPAPCGLTDGDLASPGSADAPAQFSVDLGRSTTVRLIVVRGCPGNCSVETSVDGLVWRIVGSGDDPFFSITPAVGPDVRHVRVRSPTSLSTLAEVAAW